MISVSYENPIGYYTVTSRDGEQTRIHICHANCMAALIDFHTDEEDKRCGQLVGFIQDPKHLTVCTTMGVFDNADDFHFNAGQLDKEVWRMIRRFVRVGKRVTIDPE